MIIVLFENSRCTRDSDPINSLERTRHGPESKYLEQANLHDNLQERYSTLAEHSSTFRMLEFVTEKTHSSADGSKLHDSRR